jgi:hypothetical protein
LVGEQLLFHAKAQRAQRKQKIKNLAAFAALREKN